MLLHSPCSCTTPRPPMCCPAAAAGAQQLDQGICDPSAHKGSDRMKRSLSFPSSLPSCPMSCCVPAQGSASNLQLQQLPAASARAHTRKWSRAAAAKRPPKAGAPLRKAERARATRGQMRPSAGCLFLCLLSSRSRAQRQHELSLSC